MNKFIAMNHAWAAKDDEMKFIVMDQAWVTEDDEMKFMK